MTMNTKPEVDEDAQLKKQTISLELH